VLIDYLKIGKIINRKYAALMDQLNDAIKIKHFYLAKKKVFLSHDNASTHIISSIAVTKLHELSFKLISYAVFTRFSQFFFFPSIKKWFAEKRFDSNTGVINETNA